MHTASVLIHPLNYFIILFFGTVSPSIILEVVDLIVNKTEAASFDCQATGEPVPTFSWYFKNAPLNVADAMKYELRFPLPNLNTLRIDNVQSSDAGIYTCNATNVVSSDTSSGVLTVNGEDYFIM